MCHFVFCGGDWGLMHHIDDDTLADPLYMAALEFIANNPAWWNEPALHITGIRTAGRMAVGLSRGAQLIGRPLVFDLEGRALNPTGISLDFNAGTKLFLVNRHRSGATSSCGMRIIADRKTVESTK
jgi:hypothetical protein